MGNPALSENDPAHFKDLARGHVISSKTFYPLTSKVLTFLKTLLYQGCEEGGMSPSYTIIVLIFNLLIYYL